MKVKCKNERGLEAWLTKNKKYEVLNETLYSYIIEDDLGNIGAYSKSRFE